MDTDRVTTADQPDGNGAPHPSRGAGNYGYLASHGRRAGCRGGGCVGDGLSGRAGDGVQGVILRVFVHTSTNTVVGGKNSAAYAKSPGACTKAEATPGRSLDTVSRNSTNARPHVPEKSLAN